MESLECRCLPTVAASGLLITIDLQEPGRVTLDQNSEGELLVNGEPVLIGEQTVLIADIVTIAINGSAGNDVIDARLLPDTLQLQVLAGGGDDLVAGAADYNELYGGDGKDTLLGGNSGDYLIGEAGDDYLFGSGGDDFVSGDSNNDTVRGGDGNDFLGGGNGVDILLGGAGNNNEHGQNNGGDIVIADGELGLFDLGFTLETSAELFARVDQAEVATPAATVSISETTDFASLIEQETGNSEPGTQNVGTGAGAPDDYDVAAHVAYLTRQKYLSAEWHDEYVRSKGLLSREMILEYIKVPARLRAIDVAILDRSADPVDGYTYHRIGLYNGPGAALNLTSEGVIASGKGGPDTLYGGEGADDLRGFEGNDWIFGGGGNDLLIGNEGEDAVFGDLGDDSLYGSAGDDSLHGDQGDDDLDGGSGNDSLFGDGGNDTLRGGNGNDFLRGNGGRNVLSGGAGFDWTIVETRGRTTDIVDDIPEPITGPLQEGQVLPVPTVRVSGGEFQTIDGVEMLRVEGGDGDDLISFHVTQASGLRQVVVVAGNGNDSVTASPESDVRFVFYGENGDDTLQGGGGSDRLFGGAGRDQLDGRGGDDSLNGGGNPDTLTSGTGNDTLTGGGAASDAFFIDLDLDVITDLDGRDVVTAQN